MSLRHLGIAALVVLLTGCAANIKRDAADVAMNRMPPAAASKLVLNVTGSPDALKSGDWSGFKAEWQENFAEQAARAGIPFAMQEDAARPTGEAGTLLSVYVADYRFIRPGTRYAVGIMSGNAYIESKLTFRDLVTGEVYGSQTANTSSSAWEGVLSAMTNRQVEAIATDVVRQIGAGRVSPK